MSRGLPADLHDACDDFGASMSSLASVLAGRAEATAEFTDWILQCMPACRILDRICRVEYENNPGELAAWLQAAHIKKAKAKPPAP
ncbi:MAG: hypothetical protein IPL32_03510 [Chloracidobacterium sp.]|nr:hypothetical protein [Chloracidobacterium sp.]